MSKIDVCVIGGGSAGFSAADAARSVGASVCLIEKEKLGGECPNWACVPSKALLTCAKVFRTATHAHDFGVVVRRVEFRFDEVIAYKDRVVKRITGGGPDGDRYRALARELGIEVYKGRAVFEDGGVVTVRSGAKKTERIEAKTFVIATGTTEFIPPIDGLEKAGFLTSRTVMDLKKVPKSLLVIGGGPVGVELATFFATFGVVTTLVQRLPFVLPREDQEISERALKALLKLGVRVIVDVEVVSVKKKNGLNEVAIRAPGGKQTVLVEDILLAAGKRAAVDDMGLELVGLKLDSHGALVTNAKQQTNVGHIFAAGDVDGGLQFTHTAHHEGVIAGRNAARFALGKKRGFEQRDERVVPRVTFLEPEVASVGLTEEEARKTYAQLLVGRFPVEGLGRTLTESAGEGLLKIIAEAQTREIVGAHMIGRSAGEVIHELALAMQLRATIDQVGGMIHAFPTFSEAVPGALSTMV